MVESEELYWPGGLTVTLNGSSRSPKIISKQQVVGSLIENTTVSGEFTSGGSLKLTTATAYAVSELPQVSVAIIEKG